MLQFKIVENQARDANWRAHNLAPMIKVHSSWTQVEVSLMRSIAGCALTFDPGHNQTAQRLRKVEAHDGSIFSHFHEVFKFYA